MVYVLAVKQRLELFKGHRSVNIGLDLVLLNLGLFSRAGTYEHYLAGRLVLLDILGDCRHGGEVVGDKRLQIGERLLNVIYECGTA